MKKMRLGSYTPGISLIHQLDPRTKLLGGLAIIVVILAEHNWAVLVSNTILIFGVLHLSQINLKSILFSLKWLWIIFFLSFAAQCVYTPGEPLFSLGPATVTGEGVCRGAATFLRLLILYLTSSILTMTTAPMKLAGGLEYLFAPLNRIRIPVNQFAMLTTIALRFIPTLLEEAETIIKAQKSRGAPFASPKKMVRLKASLAVLIPLVVGSLQRATDLATAMECRCYTGGPHHSRTKNLHFGRRDLAALAITAAVCVLPLACIHGW